MSSPPFISSTRPPQVEFTRLYVQPPARFYVTPEDRLYSRAASIIVSEPFRVTGRMMTPDGQIRRLDYLVQTGPVARIFSTNTFLLSEGFLLGISARTIGVSTGPGQTFIELGLFRGGEDFEALTVPLCSGYVSYRHRIGWPGGRLVDSEEGPGHVSTIVGTVPPPGNVALEQVPTGAVWKIHSMGTSLTTGAVVANRYVGVQYHLGGGAPSLITRTVSAHPASSTRFYSFYQGAAMSVALNQVVTIPIPNQGLLPSGQYIMINVSGLQAADQINYLSILREEWIGRT